ncbi:hypothetical protein [Borrelia sp. P9F1]|uniref:hypothetical protein n=1 Tax=Borrelia sp. P9F1 TaxID=3058374 RepID=UPI0026499EE7|nr:hypothetical protein [Borrelia sp. P9F1]WKC58709.1 hypothetical protein QYZ68_05760 [Borrelia sp. P9F1]
MKKLGVLLFALLSVLVGCRQEGSSLLRFSKFFNAEDKAGKESDTEEKEIEGIDTNKTDVANTNSLEADLADEEDHGKGGALGDKGSTVSETGAIPDSKDAVTADASVVDTDVQDAVNNVVPVTNVVPVVDTTKGEEVAKTSSLGANQVDEEERRKQEEAKQKQDAYLELGRKLNEYKAKLERARVAFEAGRHSFNDLQDRLDKMGGVFMDFGYYNTPEKRNYIYASFNYDANEIKQFEEIFVKLPINRLDLGKFDDQFIAKKLMELINLIGVATHKVLNESFSDANLLRLKNNQDATIVPTASRHLDDFISEREALIGKLKRHLSLAGNKKYDEALMREELIKITGSKTAGGKTDIQKAKTSFFNLRRRIEKLLK